MQREPQKTTKKRDNGQAVCLWLILFMIFEVVLVIVVLARTFKTADKPEETPSGEEVTTDSEQPGNPKPSVSVFAGGTVPTLPAATADTKTLATEIDSQYAVLVDAETGEILAQKGADTRFYPASMTKVMTLIVACEMLTEEDLERELIMTQEMLQYVTSDGYKGTARATYRVGDKIKIRDLLYGIGVESFADCTMMVVGAICPAVTVAESEQNFVALMNEKAREMGLTNTNFDNTVGYESENNYSTASEMAAIMVYALECPLIEDILSTQTRDYYVWRLEEDGVEYARWTFHYYSTLFNANDGSSRMKAYEQKYGKKFTLSNATFGGGKTGSLGESGSYTYSLVSYATKGGKTYVLVTGDTANSYAVMNDAKIIYDTYLK